MLNSWSFRKWQCLPCKKIYTNPNSLQQHNKFHHFKDNAYIHRCHICGQEYNSSAKLSNHIEKHSLEEAKIKCDTCSKLFFTDFDLKNHKRNTHDLQQDQLMCSICSFTTATKGRLKRHMILHSEERPFPCQLCNLKFKSDACWKRHLKQVHTQERKFKCRFCIKTFKTSSNLKVHENIHLGVFEARCEICNINFVQRHNLQLHNRKHHP